MKALSPALFLLPALFLVGCSSPNSNHTPPPSQFTISGTLVDLAAGSSGVVLQNNGANNLSVTSNGTFHFVTTITGGGTYLVTVMTQPASPAQQCTVANGNGTATGNVTNINVECGHNEWAWMAGSQSVNPNGTYGTLGAAGSANAPGGRQTPATWMDGSGNLWLFGGYGRDSNGTVMPLNDLWEFSGGQWTWQGGSTVAGQNGNYVSLGVASANGIPGARSQAVSWTDASGDFWLFGGNGFDSVGTEAEMNDLWKYSAGQWTWVSGSAVAKQHGDYGTLGVASANNIPGARNAATLSKDSSGNVWLFGGLGYDESTSTAGILGDLWEFSGGQWRWMSGPKVQGQKGIYGTQGVAAASNVPGARMYANSWVDSSGDLWLFGGVGYDVSGTSGALNDLWKYSSGQWTWMGGSNAVNHTGVYGTQGTAAANNTPGARQMGVAWMDASGNAWLFGGNGSGATSSVGELNDLWKYSGGQWTWVSGSSSVNQTSTYGTEGTLAPGNVPAGRIAASGWVDARGNLWLIGGWQLAGGATGNLNDLWMYMP